LVKRWISLHWETPAFYIPPVWDGKITVKEFFMKKTVLTVALILATTAMAFAQQYAPEGDFAIYPASGGVVIEEYNGRGGAVNIPPTIGGLSVIAIEAGAFQNNTTVTSLTLPNSVRRIDGFQGMTKLTTVVLGTGTNAGTGITVIPPNAFNGCTALTSVTIPLSVTMIQANAFRGCTALRNITIPASMTDIGTYAFRDCTSLATVTVMRESSGSSTGTRLGHTNVFNGTHANLVIRVPVNSVNAYKAAENWSTYASKIQ
jgi:hypothetical protein